MPKYRFVEYHKVSEIVIVEAQDEDEAREKFSDGDYLDSWDHDSEFDGSEFEGEVES